MQWTIALLRAVLYEIQPFRIKPTLHRVQLFIQDGGWKRCATTLVLSPLKSIVAILTQITHVIHTIYLQSIDLPSVQSFLVTHKTLLAKSFLAIFALRIYYLTVLYLHELLSAGPLVIIATLFTILYTIGLGENTGASSGIPSAYSVFNRGVQRILGTVDAEELARQFAGGMAAVRVGGGNNRDDDGGIWMMHHENNERNRQRANAVDEDQNDNLVNERRRQRRLERLQQQRVVDEVGPQRQVNDIMDDEEDESDDVDDDTYMNRGRGDVVAAARAGGVARKSGKKARRRNLEMRREIQRQRQVAAALGLGGEMDGGGVLLDEMMGLDAAVHNFDED